MGGQTGPALLFTDVVDSTAIVSRMEHAAAAALWSEHDRLARALLERCDGREIDRSDGFFLIFDDAARAVRFALGYHAALAELGLAARAGLHVGEVSLRRNDAAAIARGAKPLEVDGVAKPIAARLMSIAPAGRTLLSGAAHAALAEPPPETSITAHGHYRLKGIEEPLEVYEVGRADGPGDPPPDADKAYRVLLVGDLWLPVREVRHNLAPERDAFVGRARELRELGRRLAAGDRLLTVLGAGGTGKTRLVRRYARAWMGEWPGGVTFCDLSDARDATGICAATAAALGLTLSGADPVAQIGHVLAARGRTLVILDNFEQVAAHAPATLGAWVDRAADASFVVTSRERLHLPGEQAYALDPLPLDSDAIELFATRARAQHASFTLDDCRDDVARIVDMLDGLPLAIELAAARMRVLSPAQVLQRLSDRFVLLAGARGVAGRQATLRAAIDWSWDLLAPWEQSALAQCAVFDGGFTLAAAEAVLDLSPWPVAPPALDVVQALVDKSLLRTWHPGEARVDLAEPFFGMYISIHEYAAQRLDGLGDAVAGAARARHARHYAACGSDEQLDAAGRHGGDELLRQRRADLPNIVLACRRAAAGAEGATAVGALAAAWQQLEQQGPLALAIELAATVCGVAGLPPRERGRATLILANATWRRGDLEASCALLVSARDAAALADDTRTRAAAIGQLGMVRRLQDRLPEALQLLRESLELYRSIGHRGREAWALGNMANIHDDLGAADEARRHYLEAISIFEQTGDRQRLAVQLNNLGISLLHQDRRDEAERLLKQTHTLLPATGNTRDLALCCSGLGHIAYDRGLLEEAIAYHRQGLQAARDVGIRQYEGLLLGNLGVALDAAGQVQQARACYQQSLAILREAGRLGDIGHLLGNLAELDLKEGRFAEAEAGLRESLALHRANDRRRDEACTWIIVAGLELHRRDPVRAEQALGHAEAGLSPEHDTLDLARVRCLRGRLALQQADRDAALRHLDAAEETARRHDANLRSPLGSAIAALRADLDAAAPAAP